MAPAGHACGRYIIELYTISVMRLAMSIKLKILRGISG